MAFLCSKHARSEHADVLELIRVYQRLQHVPSFREHWLAVGFRQLVRVCPIRCDGTDAAAQTAADTANAAVTAANAAAAIADETPTPDNITAAETAQAAAITAATNEQQLQKQQIQQ